MSKQKEIKPAIWLAARNGKIIDWTDDEQMGEVGWRSIGGTVVTRCYTEFQVAQKEAHTEIAYESKIKKLKAQVAELKANDTKNALEFLSLAGEMQEKSKRVAELEYDIEISATVNERRIAYLECQNKVLLENRMNIEATKPMFVGVDLSEDWNNKIKAEAIENAATNIFVGSAVMSPDCFGHLMDYADKLKRGES